MAKALILKELISKLELSISGFEKEIGISNATIVKAIERNADISDKMISKISKRYENVNKEWLETGEGDILIEEPSGEKRSKPRAEPLGKHAYSRVNPEEYEESFDDWVGVPMYNAPVTASFVESYRDENWYKPSYHLHDPRFKDCNFGAIITGDSMHSEIRHGDHVICQEILDWSFVVYGDIYYIVSANGFETCKYLNADPKNDNNFLLVPRNSTISPSPLPKNMILRMYRVRGVVRGY